MAELRESSLLFSLDTLLSHERQRVEREREEAEQRRRDALEAAAAAERHRAAERARLAAETRDRLIAEERGRRDEEARLEGIKQAEIERVRRTAELESERDLTARRERHELELRARSLASGARSSRVLLIATVLLAVGVSAGGIALELFVRRPAAARQAAQARALLANGDAQLAAVRGLLADAETRRRTLAEELERRRHAPAATPSATAAPVPAVPRPRPVSHPPPHGKEKPCTGDPHDPLNPCLDH